MFFLWAPSHAQPGHPQRRARRGAGSGAPSGRKQGQLGGDLSTQEQVRSKEKHTFMFPVMIQLRESTGTMTSEKKQRQNHVKIPVTSLEATPYHTYRIHAEKPCGRKPTYGPQRAGVRAGPTLRQPRETSQPRHAADKGSERPPRGQGAAEAPWHPPRSRAQPI